MFDGPQAQTHAEREQVVERIVRDLLALYGPRVIAIGQYGSMARGDDQPYSDVELFCIVEGSAIDYSPEWVYGRSKAEVNIYSDEVARQDAPQVDDHWSLGKGQFLYARPLYGDPAYFDMLRQLVLSPPATVFNELIAAMIVGELYEWVGKARNARHTGKVTSLPSLACKVVELIALILGLQHRFCYTTGGTMLQESLQFPDNPQGYAALCQMVMDGKLDNPVAIVEAVERLWQGMAAWVVANEIDMTAGTQWPFDES